MTFEAGETSSGERWFIGDVPVGKGNTIYVNTKTGEGIDKICDLLAKFIMFQSNKVKLPFSTREDIAQELYILVLEAIPKYDITKKANILTFLQGHVQRRLINKYKYNSEKKRRATYCNISTYKVRCPSCRSFSIVSGKDDVICDFCGKEGKVKKWKKYNIPVLSVPFSYVEDCMTGSTGVGSEGTERSSLEDVLGQECKMSHFLGESFYGLEAESQRRMDFLKIFENLDEINQSIISLLLEGYSYKEIATQVGIAEKATYARVAKIISSQKAERGKNG